MRRGWLVLVILAVVGLAAGATALVVSWNDRTPVRVGLLHSATGPYATVEQSMLEAELMAIEDINAAGGLLGRPVRAVVADGRSDPVTFASQARRLIYDERVSVLIGCWSSAARRSVRPVVEQAQHLLLYPPAFEGLESSSNIVYPGGPPNQLVAPVVAWCCDVRKARKFFVIGSDSLYCRAMGAQIKDQLQARQAELVEEVYVGRDVGEDRLDVNEAIVRIEKASPDVVMSTVEEPDQAAFYGRLRRAGITPERLPVISWTLGEEEVRRLPINDVVGQYAAWNYFQSIDLETNRQFVSKVKARYGADRVVSDNFQIAYESVWIWAQTVAELETDDPRAVNLNILRQSVNAPEGIITIDAETRHGWRPCYLGKVKPDGQFEILWSVKKPIRPIAYPTSRSQEEWDALVADMPNR
jgi:urea transport system substrate-binding protein